MPYRCIDVNCGHVEDTMPLDECCPTCWKDMIEVDGAGMATGSANGTARRIGLCAILCDVSISMTECVPEMAAKDCSPHDYPTRVALVSHHAANGIWDLCQGLSNAQDAYIAVIGFGEEARILQMPNEDPFVASAETIRNMFATADELQEFLEQCFDHLIDEIGTGTDISAALKQAHALYQAACEGDLSEFQVSHPVRLLEHDLLAFDNTERVIPNFRTFIFSDGDHNRGLLINAFAEQDESEVPWATLMTAFIGSANHPGAEQLRELAGKCPTHDRRNFFLMNSAERYQRLRGLFRMASGASGFCPRCLGEQT